MAGAPTGTLVTFALTLVIFVLFFVFNITQFLKAVFGCPSLGTVKPTSGSAGLGGLVVLS